LFSINLSKNAKIAPENWNKKKKMKQFSMLFLGGVTLKFLLLFSLVVGVVVISCVYLNSIVVPDRVPYR
jgi:hypothetical protein